MASIENGPGKSEGPHETIEGQTFTSTNGSVNSFMEDQFGDNYGAQLGDDNRLTSQLKVMHFDDIRKLDVPAGESDVYAVDHGHDICFKEMVADWLDKPDHSAHRDNLQDYLERSNPGLAEQLEHRGAQTIGQVLANNLDDTVILKVHEPRKGAGFDPDYGSRLHQRPQTVPGADPLPEARDLPLLFVENFGDDRFLIIQPQIEPVNGHPPGVVANEGAELSQWGAIQNEVTEQLTYYLFDYNVIDENLRSLEKTAADEAADFEAGTDMEDEPEFDPTQATEAVSLSSYAEAVANSSDTSELDKKTISALSEIGGKLDVEDFQQTLELLPYLAPEATPESIHASLSRHLTEARNLGVEIPEEVPQALDGILAQSEVDDDAIEDY